MGMMSNWTRRKFMKNVALGAGAADNRGRECRAAWPGARRRCLPARSSSMTSD